MRKYRNQLLWGLGIALAIYGGLLLLTDTQELLRHLREYTWIVLIPVLVLKVIAWGLHFAKWQYYLNVIGAKMRLSDSLILFLSGFTLAVSPGKIAEVLKAVVIKNKTGTPIARSVPMILAERVIDGTSVLAIIFLSVLLAGDAIDLGSYRGVIYLATGLIAFGLFAVQIKPLAYFGLNLIARIPLVNRLHQPLVTFYESSREVFTLRHVLITTMLGGLAYFIDSFGMTLLLSGFGLEFSPTLFVQTMFVFGFTAALGAMSGSPNGAGVTEGASYGMYLAIIAPFHPGFDAAITAAVLLGAFIYKWLRVLVGAVVALIFRKRLFSPALEQELQALEQEKLQGAAA